MYLAPIQSCANAHWTIHVAAELRRRWDEVFYLYTTRCDAEWPVDTTTSRSSLSPFFRWNMNSIGITRTFFFTFFNTQGGGAFYLLQLWRSLIVFSFFVV
jgi:hypothetical protein